MKKDMKDKFIQDEALPLSLAVKIVFWGLSIAFVYGLVDGWVQSKEEGRVQRAQEEFRRLQEDALGQ